MNPVSDACEHTRGHCSLSRGGALYAGELSDVYGEPLDLRIEGTLPEADATALMRHAAHRGTGRPTNPDPLSNAAHRGTGRPTNPDPISNAAHRRTGADPKPAPPLSLALAQAHRRSGPPLSLALLSSPHLTLTPTLAQARDHGGRRGDGALLLSRDASRIPSARAPQLEPRLAPIISPRTAKPHPHPSSHHGAPSPPFPPPPPPLPTRQELDGSITIPPILHGANFGTRGLQQCTTLPAPHARRTRASPALSTSLPPKPQLSPPGSIRSSSSRTRKATRVATRVGVSGRHERRERAKGHSQPSRHMARSPWESGPSSRVCPERRRSSHRAILCAFRLVQRLRVLWVLVAVPVRRAAS